MRQSRSFINILLMTLIAIIILSACKGGPARKPNISGKAGDIIVVMPKAEWDGAEGEAVRSILTVEFKHLPQSEPLFTLYCITPQAFSKLYQIHRNLLIVSVKPELKEPSFKAQENVWAEPQTVVRINAPDHASLVETIKENSEIIVSVYEQAEKNRVISNSKKFEEFSLRKLVTEEFGGSPYFPKGYSLKKKVDDFVWISYETTQTTQGIFIYRYPFDSNDPMSLANIIKKRDDVMMENVPGMRDGSYMTTTIMQDPNVDPSMSWMKYKGRDYVEVRGLWEVQNDYMAGPFVSQSFLDQTGENIIVMEAFVYAPRYDKRNYLRQTESILSSFEWAK